MCDDLFYKEQYMDLILLYRMVIMDIIIMLFLLSYVQYSRKYNKDSHKFIPFAVICLMYCILGLVTEITVNSSTLSPKVNDICHIFYFAFGLSFSFNYFRYILELVVKNPVSKRLLILAGVLSATCVVIMLFSDINYIQGAGTRYSQGIGPTLCYALGFLLIIISDIIVIANQKNIENTVLYTLLPITLLAIILLIIQIIYPLFLFSESAITLICLGTFFAIEDPVGNFKKTAELYHNYAYIDALTGLFNRRAFGEELAKYKNTVPEDIICISLDLIGLKNVNDTVGHEAGDELIAEAARIIKDSFGTYGKVFRTGGDEFYGIIRASRDNYDYELNHCNELCASWKGKYSSDMKISIGAGYSEDTNGNKIQEIVSIADKRMYEDKDGYYRSTGVDRSGQVAAHKALSNLYTKILKINITEDTFSIVNMNPSEQKKELGYAETISGWLKGFGTSGLVYEDDIAEYLKKTDMEYLKKYFRSGKTSLSIFYRRKFEDGFKQAAMEMIPADDYSEDNQTLFLYVKSIDV